jgi:hypothetical protein
VAGSQFWLDKNPIVPRYPPVVVFVSDGFRIWSMKAEMALHLVVEILEHGFTDQ